MPKPSTSNPRVLYAVYWGAAEPLGQSLVLPAVSMLADRGVDVTLVTYEKPRDMERRETVAEIRERLDRRGVRWVPLRYHKRPKLPATAFDMLQGCTAGLLQRLRGRFDIVHARSFPCGPVGLALAPLLRAKLVYHNEGFYPDEQVDGGVWAAGSRPHRVARALEQRFYDRADGIVALSYRAKQIIDEMPEVARKHTPTIVVPSCVDLELFRWEAARQPVARDALRLVYIGTVGNRYTLDRIGRFVAVACRELGEVSFRVLTRAEPGLVEATLTESGVPRERWSLDSVPHASIPGELGRNHAGLFFLTQGTSEHGCSPTKIGEYWACGLPVVTTPNVSDTDEIIRRERVGVIVREHSDEEYRRAVHELRELLDDPELPLRCRRAAEAHYALAPACERQLALYDQLLSGGLRETKGARASESGGL